MEQATIVNGTTPEKLTSMILAEVRKELKELKEHYQPKEPDDLLTRNETAELLKISLVCLWDWTRKGVLHPLKIGNRTYYSRNEILGRLHQTDKDQ
ncbi:helix-turn-helix domain-containing protein [Planktosalinus lacus]|uniref:Helix-turn-helix domain-containing protein n=1 Tax=Planktosalinus lacus TaxID=1526573 RepID=A0A8J2Y9B2_9FLAO|nr:helix-turn-helix domain-containing protein [Planktosalinus lacus]GGD85905.1 hypothetical protein GCM10011312_07400 [Planktosalinus lacus]